MKKDLKVLATAAVLIVLGTSVGLVVFQHNQPIVVNTVTFGDGWHHTGESNLTDNLAWQVCDALRAPCPSNPVYLAMDYTNGTTTALLVNATLIQANVGSTAKSESVQIVILGSQAYCTTANYPWIKNCPQTID